MGILIAVTLGVPRFILDDDRSGQVVRTVQNLVRIVKISPAGDLAPARVLRCGVALRTFRPSATTVLVAALLALLPVLATAQYRWLGQISENERGRLQRALLNAMSGVARDLDTEVASAVGQLDIEGLVSGRFPAGAPVSQPVTDVLYIKRPAGNDASLSLSRCDLSARSCSPIEWPAELSALSHEIARALGSGSSHDSERLSRIVRTAHGSQPVIVLALGEGNGYHGQRRDDTDDRGGHDRSSGVTGVALLLLNEHWLRSELVPRIIDRHFGPATESDFRVAIVTRDVPVDVVYADRNTALDPFGRPKVDGAQGQTVDEIVAQPEGRQALLTLRVGMRRDRWSPHAADEGDEWVMVARHRSGSLQQAVDDVRRRNLLISSGILSLMGIAVGLIAVTTRRAHRLAQQQIEFVAGVSHELRTPVAAIHLAAQNLADGTVTDASRIRRYGATIQTEAQRLRDTVERVLQFAAISAGQPIGSRVLVDIGALVEDVAASARAEQADADIKVTVGAGLPTVLGDPLALRACVQNLLANALKYGGRPPRVQIAISVAAHRHGSELRLSFADNGPGISADERKHVFEPFFRGQAALEQRVQGSGLGLHLVRRLVTAHGGRVDVLHSAGKGATFLIHLPIGAHFESPTRAGTPDVGAFTAPDGVDFRRV